MIRKIKNLKELEEAFENGLKKEDAISLIIEDKILNGIFIGKTRNCNGDLFLMTVEENCRKIERRLYKIKKSRIDYRGPLDAKPEDVERIEKLKGALYEKIYGEKIKWKQ